MGRDGTGRRLYDAMIAFVLLDTMTAEIDVLQKILLRQCFVEPIKQMGIMILPPANAKQNSPPIVVHL